VKRALIALIIAGCLSLCPASVLYDSLGGASSGADLVNGAPWPSGHGPLYNSFSTGASGFSLLDVVVMVGLRTPTSSSTTVALYSDSGSATPGSLLAELGQIPDSALSTLGLIQYELVLSSPYTLAANTRYWIQLSASGSSAVWSWTFDSSGTGVASEYTANQGGVLSSQFGPYQMRLSDQASGSVPEPTSLFVMGGALLALSLLRRKRAA
jgi:hypothetical protein